MLKIRRPLGRLIFNMGIAIPGKTVFLIETAPWYRGDLTRHCRHGVNRVRLYTEIKEAVYEVKPRPLLTHWGRNKISHFADILNAFSSIQAFVQMMAWRRPGDKPLSEPMMVSFLTHICITRPQWVNNRYYIWLRYWWIVTSTFSWYMYLPYHAPIPTAVYLNRRWNKTSTHNHITSFYGKVPYHLCIKLPDQLIQICQRGPCCGLDPSSSLLR